MKNSDKQKQREIIKNERQVLLGIVKEVIKFTIKNNLFVRK